MLPCLIGVSWLDVLPECLISTRPPPNRFDGLNKRIIELQPPTETQSESSSAEGSSASSSDASSAKDDERGASKTETHPESSDGAGKRGEGSIEGKDEQGKPPQESGEGSSGKPETEEEMLRQEVEMLVDKRNSLMVEMFTCSQFHHVFEDSNADDGLVPDMPDEEAEGGGEATSGKGSGAGDGDSSGMAEKEKVEESREQPPADESAGK